MGARRAAMTLVGAVVLAGVASSCLFVDRAPGEVAVVNDYSEDVVVSWTADDGDLREIGVGAGEAVGASIEECADDGFRVEDSHGTELAAVEEPLCAGWQIVVAADGSVTSSDADRVG